MSVCLSKEKEPESEARTRLFRGCCSVLQPLHHKDSSVFAVLVDNRVKIKESRKINKYLDLTRELKKKKLRKMRVMVIPVVADAPGTVPEGSEKNLGTLNRDHLDHSIIKTG